jgi:hypothetical protein
MLQFTLIQIMKTRSLQIILLIVALLNVNATIAQHHKANKIFYKGFDVCLAVHSTTVKSTIEKIDGMQLVTEGGSAGIVYGTEVLRSNLMAGFYYSAASVKQTIDQVKFGKSVSFYPIALIKKRVQPLEVYLVSGITYEQLKFAGEYLGGEKTANVAVNDVYFGKIHSWNINYGAGIEYKFFDNKDFLHLYADVRQSSSVSSDASMAALSETAPGKQLVVRIGVRFGLVK